MTHVGTVPARMRCFLAAHRIERMLCFLPRCSVFCQDVPAKLCQNRIAVLSARKLSGAALSGAGANGAADGAGAQLGAVGAGAVGCQAATVAWLRMHLHRVVLRRVILDAAALCIHTCGNKFLTRTLQLLVHLNAHHRDAINWDKQRCLHCRLPVLL